LTHNTVALPLLRGRAGEGDFSLLDPDATALIVGTPLLLMREISARGPPCDLPAWMADIHAADDSLVTCRSRGFLRVIKIRD